MRARLSSLLFGLAMAISSLNARAEESPVKDIEADLSIVKRLIDDRLSLPERGISKDIRLWVPNTLSLRHVGAYRDDTAKRTIAINVGLTIRLMELSRAISIDSKFINDERYLLGYLRYLAYSDQFSGKFIPADDFAVNFLGNSLRQRLDKLTPAEIQNERQIYANALAFVVAHEIAHHVLGHLDDQDLSGSAQRKREEEADLWATSAIFKAGFTPVASIFTMLLFNEAYERSEKVAENSTHPAPIARAVQLSKNAVDLLERSLQEEPTSQTIFTESQVRSLLNGSRRIHEIVKSHAAAQNALDDPIKLLKAAELGNRYAQLRVGELYTTGKSKAFLPNIRTSRDWYQKAADNKQLFDYMDQVDADSRVGWMYGFMPTKIETDFSLACFYLKRSAGSAYETAVWAYEKLIQKGKCGQ